MTDAGSRRDPGKASLGSGRARKRPGSKAVAAYLAAEVEAGNIVGPFHSAHELVAELRRERRRRQRSN